MVSAAWFIDGGYLDHVWTATGRTDKIDFLKLRRLIETRYLDHSIWTIEKSYS